MAFLGSGTTSKSAIRLGRNSVGYEINQDFLPMIKEKIEAGNTLVDFDNKLEILKREKTISVEPVKDYVPNIKDAKPLISPEKLKFKKETLYKVKEVKDNNLLELDTGLKVSFAGVKLLPEKADKTKKYLEEYVKGKQVFLKFEPSAKPENDII